MPAQTLGERRSVNEFRINFVIGIAFLLIVALAVTAAGAAEPPKARRVHDAKLDKALREITRGQGEKMLRVIVRTDARTRAGRARTLALRGVLHAEHALIDGLTATLSLEEIDALTLDDDVLHVSIDAPVAGQQTFTPGEVLRDTLGFLPGGGVQSGGNSFAGDKIVVGVIDSGIQPSKDVDASRIDAFYDFTQGGRAVKPYDDYGHGTHVAGLIGGSGDLSHDRFEGAASKAHFVAFKVLDRVGAGYTSQVLSAIEYAITHRARLKLRILNLSLGHPIYEPAATDPLVQAVERASRAGLIVVVSAGNNGEQPGTGLPGYGGINSPGNAPSAITVGAIDIKRTVERSDDVVQVYSSRGPSWHDGYAKPDVVAPGHRLVASAALQSTLYLGNPLLQVTGDHEKKPAYLRLSGTSMAAAVTSGVVAVMLEARDARYASRPLTANLVKAVLQHTAIAMPNEHALAQGAGSLNPQGAVRLTEALNPTVPVGAWWLQTSLAPGDRIGADMSTWGQTLIWGDRLLPGDVLYENSTAWGTTLIWGDTLVWGDRLDFSTRSTSLVWGDTLVWGDSLVWGDTVLGLLSRRTITWGDTLVWGDADPADVVWKPIPAGLRSGSTAATSLRH